MNPATLFRFFAFLFANAADISKQINGLIEFARELRDRFDEFSISSEGEAVDVRSLSAEEIDGLIDRFAPASVLYGAGAFSSDFQLHDSGEVSITAAIGDRGILRDLFRWIIENPDKAIEFFELIRELFGFQVRDK